VLSIVPASTTVVILFPSAFSLPPFAFCLLPFAF
jgi:hypothetical protein